MSESFPLTWEEVARSHGRKIYNFAYRLSGNPHDAADLVQEVAAASAEQASGVAQMRSLSPAARSKLPQTRDAKQRPVMVSTGTPIQSASDAVVCAP